MQGNQGRLTDWLFLAGLALLFGCNQAAPTADTAGNGTGEATPPTASIGSPDLGEDDPDEPDDDVAVKEPEPGTPEWHIREILKVRLQPIPPLEGSKTAKAGEGSEEKVDPAMLQQHMEKIQRERNLQVIELARQAMAMTHKDAEKTIVFNAAVHHMLDARLQLALGGEQADVNALYEITEALQTSKPNTEIASAAALTIVNFSHANAVRYAQSEPKWIQEFAHQAQLFATRVLESQPQNLEKTADGEQNPKAIQWQNDASRAAQILVAAGQSCDTAGFADDARTCYLMVKNKFSQTPQAQQVVGVLRRLSLQGKPLQLAGPTLDGNYISIEDFKGKTVVVVFWSSQAKPFVDQLPALTDLLKRAQKQVSVVGVSLDTDESQLDAFLEETGLTWPQIFHSEPDKRGWNSPLAMHYGISQVPSVWIIDPTGVVAATDVAATELEPKLREVVRNNARAGKPTGNGTVTPASNSSPQ